MAPEQTRGDAVDARTDVYAVGLVLFKMLTGRGAFEGAATSAELLHAQQERPAPRLAGHAPTAPPDLEEVVARALAKSRAQRPGSAAEMAAALRTVARRLAAQRGTCEGLAWLEGRRSTPPGASEWTAAGTLIVDRDSLRAVPHARPHRPTPGRADLDTADDLTAGEETDHGGFEDLTPPPASPPHSDRAVAMRVERPRRSAWLRQGAASVGLAAVIVVAFLGGQRVRARRAEPAPATNVRAASAGEGERPWEARRAHAPAAVHGAPPAREPAPSPRPLEAPEPPAAVADERVAPRKPRAAPRSSVAPARPPVVVAAAATRAAPSAPAATAAATGRALEAPGTAEGLVSPWSDVTVAARDAAEQRAPERDVQPARKVRTDRVPLPGSGL